MNVDARKIINMSADGLTYLDESGNEVFIDFSVCYANYITEFMRPEHLQHLKKLNNMSDDELAAWLKSHEDWREVAKRDITGWQSELKLPFIEFHTVPPTRFDFAGEDEFQQTRVEIEKFGWHTYDLS